MLQIASLTGRALGGAAVLVAGLATSGCTDSGLQASQPPAGSVLDDEVLVEASVCTQPALDAYFPVKVLFVVDTSDSMSVTDRAGLRAQAVVDVLSRYAGSPSVEFAVIAFDAQIANLTDGFTNSPDIGAISSRLSEADRLTDYQGALGAAYTLLSTDMQASSPAERTRTKYVVVFFTDGAPDPQCSGEVDEADTFMVCEVPRDDWASAFDPPLDSSLYPALEAGGDYNQPEQIYQAVDDIVSLQDFYRVGEVRLHSGFLFDPEAASDPLAEPFHLDREEGIDLLTRVAERGGGTFTEFDSATSINFLAIDYTSIKERYELASFFATNLNATMTAGGLVPDSDGDGLADALEQELALCYASTATCDDPDDTDGDGFSDLIEERNLISGFDPDDGSRPAEGCAGWGDLDHDGLRDCEESFLGTDSRLFDSDGDRLPDLIEIRTGLDPLDTGDALEDLDHDGERNADEARAHLDPLVREVTTQSGGYLYEVGTATELYDGRTCYEMAARHIRLVTTGHGSGSALGRNRIYVYFLEAPANRPLDFGELRIACFDARFVDGAIKSPPSGHVVLAEEQFVAVSRFDPDRDCLDLTSVREVDAGVPDASADAGVDAGAP